MWLALILTLATHTALGGLERRQRGTDADLAGVRDE